MATADVWSDFFDASTHYTGPPLTDAMVVSAERALGYALPASYLQLLRAKNSAVIRRLQQTRTPHDELVEQELPEAIERILSKHVRPEMRRIFEMHRAGQSYEEIAEILQVNIGTVKSRILRGREALRHVLLERMSERSASERAAFQWSPQTAE